MRKTLLFLVALFCVSALVLAQGPNEGAGSGGQMPEEAGSGEQPVDAGVAEQVNVATQNQGEEQQLMVQQRERVMAQTPEEVGQMVQERQREMSQEMSGLGDKEQKVMQNQNQVRLAVHALLSMEGLTDGIGPQVSEIAKNFDNSVQATIRAENRIQAKSGFARLFSGGDEEAAEELEAEVTQNRQRIQELKQLVQDCDCGEEVKAMMQEQVQSMEQEQNRLQELAQKEKKSKGLFGWIWK